MTWETWGHGFFTTYCTSCHSTTTAQRSGAPVGIDFEDEEDIATWAGSIRSVVIDNQTMPVGSGLYDEDFELLDAYLSCGIRNESATSVPDEQPDAALDVQGVADTLASTLALGLPESADIVDVFKRMFEGGDSGCPGNTG